MPHPRSALQSYATAVLYARALSPEPEHHEPYILTAEPCVAANFRVVALRKGATLVTVATLRVFGTHFAEMPFVATKDGATQPQSPMPQLQRDSDSGLSSIVHSISTFLTLTLRRCPNCHEIQHAPAPEPLTLTHKP